MVASMRIRIAAGRFNGHKITLFSRYMDSYPQLNFPAVKLRAERRNGQVFVWDALRGCWLLLTPEEWVRRHVVEYLRDGWNIPAVNIIQEYPVSVEGMPQRADIVVVNNDQKPVMLVECKAPEIKITSGVLDQAVRYNNVIGARYILITNGLKHYSYCSYDGVKYIRMDSFPELDLS